MKRIAAAAVAAVSSEEPPAPGDGEEKQLTAWTGSDPGGYQREVGIPGKSWPGEVGGRRWRQQRPVCGCGPPRGPRRPQC